MTLGSVFWAELRQGAVDREEGSLALGALIFLIVGVAARRWLEPGPLPAELLVPYPAEAMTSWRVADEAKYSRIEPHPRLAEAVSEA